MITRRRRLYIAAVNNAYGRNVFLPYAAGLLWGYARRQPVIADAYDLAGMLYLKEPIDRALKRLDAPDVVAFSSYIWNHEWNRTFARAVRDRWPACVTVVGGVQVPDESTRILDECPEFRFAIYGEGEGAFADFLAAHAHGSDYAECASLVYRVNGSVRVNARRPMLNLVDVPSPYLDGLFAGLITDEAWEWQALQETNRGCVYDCSFCAWGASSLSKLRSIPVDRIVAEFEWMGRHRVGMLYNCDANYGILPRDVDLTDALIRTKERLGYPRQFRAAYAKNSNDVVLGISRALHRANMHKATTLAVQSVDDGVLVNIKRKNIRHDRLADLAGRYKAEGIPTYVEVIVGLPGETLDSYVRGIDRLLDAGLHDGLSIYLCLLLENTEMATPESRARFGIESVKMRALLYHATPDPEVVEEAQETVIATAAMPRNELRRAVLYGWVVQAFHSLGLTQDIARALRVDELAYRGFYGALLDWMLDDPGLVAGRALARVAVAWDRAVDGGPWNLVDARYGNVSWPPEEMLFLDVASESDRFYDELEKLAPAHLVDAQRAAFVPPVPGREAEYARNEVWYRRKGTRRLVHRAEE